VSSRRPDLVVIGAGVVGLAVARAWVIRHPGHRVVVLEKEPAPGRHASGRNSGVLHAGFYYEPGSMKARFTREGNRQWQEFCSERGVRIRKTGKLLLATRPRNLEAFPLLLLRAHENGVPLREVSREEAREIQPRVQGQERALYSPETATLDPAEAVAGLVRDAKDRGVVIETGIGVTGVQKRRIRLSDGRRIEPGFIVNAAGLQADRVARWFGFSPDHRILPFRGNYLLSSNDQNPVRTCVYPVPDLARPFLGVHLTAGVDGREKIGPSARPALWREQYGGLRGFRPRETAEIGWRQLRLLVRNDFGFRSLARAALREGRHRMMVDRAADLISGVSPAHYTQWGRPGIRAQLVDIRKSRLETDFRIEGDEHSLHILNAVSPGFTCAFPFADYLVRRMESGTAGADGSRP